MGVANQSPGRGDQGLGDTGSQEFYKSGWNYVSKCKFHYLQQSIEKKKKPLKLLVILPPRHTGYKGFGICYFLPVFYTQTDVAGFLFDFYTQDYIWSTFPCHGILSERMNFSGYIILLHMRYVRIHLTISFLLTCEWHSIFNDE